MTIQTPFFWDDKFREWSPQGCARAKPAKDARRFISSHEKGIRYLGKREHRAHVSGAISTDQTAADTCVRTCGLTAVSTWPPFSAAIRLSTQSDAMARRVLIDALPMCGVSTTFLHASNA
jgi:hypothetical protein